jgi:hypothetical protein
LNPKASDQRWTWLLAAALAAVVGAGCSASASDSGSPNAPAAGTGGSGGAGAPPEQDAGAGGQSGGAGDFLDGSPLGEVGADAFIDNPVDRLFAVPERTPPDILGEDVFNPQAYVATASACYSGHSNAPACGEADCEAFASCCVATGNCCEVQSNETLDFVQCAGSSLDACASAQGVATDSFGPDAPMLNDGGLVPNGGVTAEGGALVGDVVSPASERVVLSARFTAPRDCGGACLQSAGVAVTAATDSFEGVAAGLLLSGSREVVSLILGGEAVDEFEAGVDTTRWGLELSPDGVVHVMRDGASMGEYPFDAGALEQARVAVFGRNLGPLSTSAAVASLTIRSELCDAPTAWPVRMPLLLTLGEQASPALTKAEEPSIEAGFVAFELDGEVFVAEQQGFAHVDVLTPEPAIVPLAAFEEGGVGAPELFTWLDTLHAIYTAYDANGVGRIGAAVMSEGLMQQRPAPVLSPSGDEVSLERPTLIVRDDLLVMVVHATLQSGATELRAYYSNELGLGWARIVGGTLEELTHVDEPTSEAQSPSLIVHNGAYQLYYARRAGTRWSIELAVSDELLIWRPLGEVLGPSGEGFDSMGARGADALSSGSQIELVFMGLDGVSSQLGYAARATPTNTASTTQP